MCNSKDYSDENRTKTEISYIDFNDSSISCALSAGNDRSRIPIWISISPNNGAIIHNAVSGNSIRDHQRLNARKRARQIATYQVYGRRSRSSLIDAFDSAFLA